MRASVEDDAAIGAHERCEAGRFASHLLAEGALERRSELLSPAFRLQDPGPQIEGRLMTHVLLVSAGELGYPVAVFVLVVADDRLLHAVRVRAKRSVPDDG